MTVKTSPEFEAKLAAYPAQVIQQMHYLRTLVRSVAENTPEVTRLEETLKWGEPSFLTNKGSTLRMDWKAKAPEQYALYFKCTSRLVPTIRTLYDDLFTYEKNRAILFALDDDVPEGQLRSCIRMALRYHVVKEEPGLGE